MRVRAGGRSVAQRVAWVLVAMVCGCGPIGSIAQGFEGPSEVVGRSPQWFLDNVGVPCSKERSPIGGEVWLYAQEADTVKLLECGTPGVKRAWAIYFTGTVCT